MKSLFDAVATAHTTDKEGQNVTVPVVPAFDLVNVGIESVKIGLIRLDPQIKVARRQTDAAVGYHPIYHGDLKSITLPVPRKPDGRIEYVAPNNRMVVITPLD